MTYTDEVIRRLSDVDPAPVDTELPLAASTTALLAAIAERSDIHGARPDAALSSSIQWRRGVALAVAVFIAIVGLGAMVLLLDRGPESEVINPATSTTAAPTTTTSMATTTTTEPTTASIAPSTTTTAGAPIGPFGPIHVSFSFTITVGVDSPGTLVATGTAVDTGLMCPTGTSYETGYENLGSGNERWITHVRCDDGSGRLKLECDSLGRVEDTAWVADDVCSVADGSDRYVGMTGEVAGTTTCLEDECVVEYHGEIRRDE